MLVLACLSGVALAQTITVTGTVTDEEGLPMPQVSVLVEGTTIGVPTDLDGKYRIKVPSSESVLEFRFVGYVTQKIKVAQRTIINVILLEDTETLEAVEVVSLGYGEVKKDAVTGAMTSIKPSELKIPASNLTTALAGRLSGVVSFQTSGEPGADNAQFFVRGVASFNGDNGPLILIDGVQMTQDDLARLQPDDIESFSVLKDPTTTAIYGARGANGIILVTTKPGIKGKPVVSLRMEQSFQQPAQLVEMTDPITYMRLQNQANVTRGEFPTFTEEKIANTERGLNPNLYPNVNWFDELFQKYSVSRRINLNVRGGGETARYYVGASFNDDGGILKNNPKNPFKNNIDLKRYMLRSNVNIDLTEDTEMIVRLSTVLDDYRGPLQSGTAFYKAAVRVSPVRFLPVFQPDESLKGVPHILFGNDLGPRAIVGAQAGIGGGAVWYNPYAELMRGYRDYQRQVTSLQLEFKQNLKAILPGLSARFLGNYNSTSSFTNRRGYRPYFYRIESANAVTGKYKLLRVNEGNESLDYTGGRRAINSVKYMETAVNYYKSFKEKHNVSGLLVVTMREASNGNSTDVQSSLPRRNLNLAGRYNYDFDNRYFAEFNFGYNGSERFAENNRFGFFPSFGLAWQISNEDFFNSSVISRLKLRSSFGWTGSDNLGGGQGRFFYLSNVNIDNFGRGYNFGTEFNERMRGVSISRYANPQISWERSRKTNIGLELNFFKDAVQFRVDAFEDYRSSILQTRADIPTTMGLQATMQTNVGEVLNRGIDASLNTNVNFSNGMWLTSRSTFVYTDNKYMVYEEPNYRAIGAPWLSRIGTNVNVARGYIAERLFVDDEEALNSPLQFGTPGVDYGGGDIKYKDLNGDGKITNLDLVPIGNPLVPRITYGFGLSGGWKDFDISFFFQGLGQVSFMINPYQTGPFIDTFTGGRGGNGRRSENGMLKAYAEDHWSEENRNVYALWPRLSTSLVSNNGPNSTFWLRNGSFIRLKQAEIGYDLANTVLKSTGIKRCRLYVNGTNLITWSSFKLWDPELKGSGLNYPLQRVFNIGLNVGF